MVTETGMTTAVDRPAIKRSAQALIRAIAASPFIKQDPVGARRAMLEITGHTVEDLAVMSGKSRQLFTMLINGHGRSDEIEHWLANLMGVQHDRMFPEPRQRRPQLRTN